MTITTSRTWADLAAHCQKLDKTHLRDLFASDPQRVESLSLTFDDILYDFSKGSTCYRCISTFCLYSNDR